MADADYGLITDAATETEDWDLVAEGVVTEDDWGLLSEDGPETPTLLTSLADAVVDELNGETWSQSFVAARVAFPEYTLPSLSQTRVPVVIAGSYPERLTRAESLTVVEIDIGVLRKLEDVGRADVDPYLVLVDEIVRHFHGTRLPGYPNALCKAIKPEPIYSREYLRKERAFFAVVRIEFRVFGA